MSGLSLTPWYRGATQKTRPGRPGVYQTAFKDSATATVFWRHWDGAKWGDCSRTADNAKPAVKGRDDGGPNYWRGLAEEPK